MVNATPRPLYPRERDPVPIVQDAGWAPRPVGMDAENLARTGIRSPDRPASNESLSWPRLAIVPIANRFAHSSTVSTNLFNYSLTKSTHLIYTIVLNLATDRHNRPVTKMKAGGMKQIGGP